MKGPYIPSWNLFAYMCSSNIGEAELVDAATKFTSNRNILLVLKYDDDIEKRMGSAYLNMMIRFNDHMNRYKRRSLEMLMLLYSDNEIGRNASTIKLDNKKFILFSDSKILFDRFAKANGIKKLRKIKIIPNFDFNFVMQ